MKRPLCSSRAKIRKNEAWDAMNLSQTIPLRVISDGLLVGKFQTGGLRLGAIGGYIVSIERGLGRRYK